MGRREKIKDFFQKKDKKIIITWAFFSIVTFGLSLLEFFAGNNRGGFFCVITLLLLDIPFLLEYLFSISFSSMLTTFFFLFIFFVEIFGKVFLFFMKFSYWDIFMHLFSGFLCAGIGLGIFFHFTNQPSTISPFLKIFFAFCFSVTVGVFWEVCEFTGDQLFHLDNQNDTILSTISTVEFSKEKKQPVLISNIDYTDIYYRDHGEAKRKTIYGYLDIGIIDTMKDLIDGIIGAFFFSILYLLHIRNPKRYLFLEKLIPFQK